MTLTREQERRLEILELFDGLSIFDRSTRKGVIGYSQVGSWLARKPRERKLSAAKQRPSRAKPKRQPLSREERRRRDRMRENARYHAMSPEQKRARNAATYEAVKRDRDRLDARRAYNREQARRRRSSGKSDYQRMTPAERKAYCAAVYAAKKSDPGRLEKMRTQKREWMRKKRARLRQEPQP